MSLLLRQELPFLIDGQEIYPSFRNMIQIEKLWQTNEIASALKPALALRLLYKEPQKDIKKALDGLFWFYRCGKETEKERAKKTVYTEPMYSFEYDAELIYAAFYQAYGINLSTISFLHWWEFQALLKGLPESTQFVQVLGYRTMDVSGMEPKQKAYYQKMKEYYKLPSPKGRKPINVQEQQRNLREWIDKRFAVAEGVKLDGV